MDMRLVERLHCPVCGISAACDCGVAPVRRAENALIAKPGLSDRAIAEEIGVSHPTVAKARKATGKHLPVATRTGKDGKVRVSPKPRLKIIDTAADPVTEGCPDCSTSEEEWQRSVMNIASDAISLPAYWSRQFGDGWKTFVVTSQMVVLAKQAADEWTKLAGGFAKRKKEKRK